MSADDRSDDAIADRMEPGTGGMARDSKDRDGVQAAALLSIAISAKRIADVLTGSGDQAALFGMMQNLMWEAGRSFQAGTRTDR